MSARNCERYLGSHYAGQNKDKKSDIWVISPPKLVQFFVFFLIPQSFAFAMNFFYYIIRSCHCNGIKDDLQP